MNFKVKGKIIVLLPEQSGVNAAGKEWKKKDFVIETDEGQYSKKIAFTLFNKTLDYGLNAEVEVSFSVESREYNEKWYSNVNAFAVELIGVAPPQSPVTQKNEPAQSPGQNMADKKDDSDDLPF